MVKLTSYVSLVSRFFDDTFSGHFLDVMHDSVLESFEQTFSQFGERD